MVRDIAIEKEEKAAKSAYRISRYGVFASLLPCMTRHDIN